MKSGFKRISLSWFLFLVSFSFCITACTGKVSSSDPDGDAGIDAGADAGSDPGADPGSDPGADPGSDPGADPGSDPGSDPGPGDPGADQGPQESFSFIVFGDLNGGGCEKNERLNRLVGLMLGTDASFFVQTGDVIDGYGDTSCFGSLPDGCPCNTGDESANMRDQLAPLMNAPVPQGLNASYFQVIGNHDGNWGSDWYPDPCSGGICDLLGLDEAGINATYLTHPDTLSAPGFFPHSLKHGPICNLDQGQSGHPDDFFYSFSYGNSLFIVLSLMEDYYGMFNCNSHPGYDSCEEYCSDLSLLEDAERAGYCYSVYQYDWLVNVLQGEAAGHEHIFVFAHAPLLSSGDNHGATVGADYYRSLLESYSVTIYFNGHNHAYERTHPVLGGQLDANGTTYITVGTAGALTDGNEPDWFTAKSYQDWTSYGDYEQMTTYLRITVDGAAVSGEVVTLSGNVVDQFAL